MKLTYAVLVLLTLVMVVSCVSQQEMLELRAKNWTNPPGATYVGDDTCLGCHEKEGKKFALSWHGSKTDDEKKEKRNCEYCHGAGSRHVDGNGDPRFIFKKQSKNCMNCHEEKAGEFRLVSHHPVPEGKMDCADCHTVHATPGLVKKSTTENKMCLSCHENLRGPWVYEHEAMRDGCTSCHDRHGSSNPKMVDPQICITCHFSSYTSQGFGHYSHRRSLNTNDETRCTACHNAIHGSNFSKEFRTP